ncbi:MAG: hypothetical protein JTT17_06080 [Candidatus Brockarchaeota archaeon]|nr:hypothetical protein [Candidatus Brockarchaeota archaeon]
MKEVLVLCNGLTGYYWESSNMARYLRKSLRPVQHLKNTLPIPGIGVYIKHRGGDFSSRPPCFLIVRGMSENDKGEAQFNISFISKMEGVRISLVSSKVLLSTSLR